MRQFSVLAWLVTALVAQTAEVRHPNIVYVPADGLPTQPG